MDTLAGLRNRLTLVTCAHDETDMEHVCSSCILAHIGPLLAAHETQVRADERRKVLGDVERQIEAQAETGLFDGYTVRRMADIVRAEGRL